MKLFLLPLLLTAAAAFDYEILGIGNIILTDVSTGITPVEALFLSEAVKVKVDELEWGYTGTENGTNTIEYKTFVDGMLQGNGTIELTGVNRELPPSFECGEVVVSSSGTHTIEVVLTLNGADSVADKTLQAYRPGSAIIPLLVVLIFAMTTHMVEFSLFVAIFVGACMVAGNIKDGFFVTLERFILEAVADGGHGYVYLFTLFLSGVVGMLEKSGGMKGFARDVARCATSSRSGQLVTFAIGCFIFFDDYANSLLAGQTMQPLTDMLFVSREKLAFIVDATSAPIASITPVSSWVGFEVSLIQAEIDTLAARYGEENLTIDTSALGVFLQSIKYRYYPIFMLILMPVMIYTQRDFGNMLIAERKVRIYERLDGGDGAATGRKGEGFDDSPNAPRPDTPGKTWNMVVPVGLLVFFIFYLLVRSGDDGTGLQSFMDKLQASDSYVALLFGTMAAALVTIVFYAIQIVQGGHYVLPTPKVFKEMFFPPKLEDGEEYSKPRPIMNLKDSLESFLHGMAKVFPALIVLTLAWATGAMMTAVGVNRLFSTWIVGGVSAATLPTLSFIISAFMALATGTSWGTMAIIFPLIMVPTYEVADGDPTIFYATVAGILSGAVAGDHVSPISDTTVLSALACDCELLKHVTTQAPYSAIVIILSILFGTVPIGRGAYPSYAGVLLGTVAIVLINFFLFVPVVNKTGRYDIITEVVQKIKKDSLLEEIRSDTVEFFEHGGLLLEGKKKKKKKMDDTDRYKTTEMSAFASKDISGDVSDDTPEETGKGANEDVEAA